VGGEGGGRKCRSWGVGGFFFFFYLVCVRKPTTLTWRCEGWKLLKEYVRIKKALTRKRKMGKMVEVLVASLFLPPLPLPK